MWSSNPPGRGILKHHIKHISIHVSVSHLSQSLSLLHFNTLKCSLMSIPSFHSEFSTCPPELAPPQAKWDRQREASPWKENNTDNEECSKHGTVWRKESQRERICSSAGIHLILAYSFMFNVLLGVPGTVGNRRKYDRNLLFSPWVHLLRFHVDFLFTYSFSSWHSPNRITGDQRSHPTLFKLVET